ncbi:MAG TPA: hypothetical protein VN520_27650 [Streptomyces sp.]|nr:hypothetical protein [Streptomyces sp.]HWU10104.1 hypothetical protein [Streptomyces sp.]
MSRQQARQQARRSTPAVRLSGLEPGRLEQVFTLSRIHGVMPG